MNGRFARRYRFVLVWMSALLELTTAAFAAPAITNIAPRGLQIGQPTTVVITGTDLSADLQLLTELKIARQKVKPGAKPNRVELEVELDKGTLQGLFAVRVANAGGISS